MRRTTWRKTCLSACFVALALGGPATFPQQKAPPKKGPPVKKVAVGRSIFVEVEDQKAVRVLVEASVCLRKGALEHLLTRRGCKEHEAILAADIDARDLHAALLLTGAEPGRPMVFRPKAKPPSGTAVKITLAYKNKGGKEVKLPAQQWIRHVKTGKDLHVDWVFVGSVFVVDDADPAKVRYLAQHGDVICVANFESALLDLPILSTASGEVDYEAHTDRIPPLQTPVLVILEPARPKKK